MKKTLLIFFLFAFCISEDNQDVALTSVDSIVESSSSTIQVNPSTTSTTITSTTTTLQTTTTSTSTTITTLPTEVINVKEAQILLQNLGIYAGEIDGINGSLTKNAIREFQKLAGLVVDGVLGPKTISALINGESSYIKSGFDDMFAIERTGGGGAGGGSACPEMSC